VSDKILEVKDLSIHFYTEDGDVAAVNGVTIELERGDTLGLVGETGAGKTTTALGILRLIANPPGKIVSGEIFCEGENLLEKTEKEMQKIRGGKIAMIFQDPMTALNPVLRVDEQIAEVVHLHSKCSQQEALSRALTILEKVGIPASRGKDFPHQFSGGMKQRVVIAMALSCNPQLLLADEPTTALDVTIQAQVLDMMKGLKDEFGTTMVLITHDLGVVAENCNKVAVMYAGQIVESGAAEDIFNATAHPYTKGLFNSLPSLSNKTNRLKPIRGLMPDPANLPSGCSFHPRCPYADQLCAEQEPGLVQINPGHFCRCHHTDKGVELYFPDETINENAYNIGLPTSNPGNNILGKEIEK
jgi:peptide/nickel transport system ATP-binding protein